MKTNFSNFEVVIILIIVYLVPILIFSVGIIVLFQENFSKDAIIFSFFPFILGISSFFALNLHQVSKEVLRNSSPPVRTSDRKSDTKVGFNTDLKEVQK